MDNPSPDIKPLIQLLHTGKLYALEIGMGIDDVLDYLGLPYGIESLSDLRNNMPELWEVKVPEGNSFPSILHGCVFSSFKEARLKRFAILVNNVPEHVLPQPLDGGWREYLKTMTHNSFKAFLSGHDLGHIRYNRIRLPHAWVSENPPIEISLDFSSSSTYIKAIFSGDLFD